MPTEATQKPLSREFDLLLRRPENFEAIDKIAKSFSLEEDQVFYLSAAVGQVIKGMIPLEELGREIEDYVVVDKDTSYRIALDVLLTMLYSYWPLFPSIDEVIKNLGGEVPTEKPAMPKELLEGSPVVEYPAPVSEVAAEKPALLGGLEIPLPPEPRSSEQKIASNQAPTMVMPERDVPWKPEPKIANSPVDTPKNVARPGDVASLLEKNLIKTYEDQAKDPRIKGNVVDLTK